MNNNYFLQGSMTDEPESLPDWALEPTGAPEEFGLPKDSSPSKKRVWNRQEVFLAAFAECGKLNKAAEASGISYWTVVHWQKHDVFEFVKRLEHAHQKYCENKIESIIEDRISNPQGNRGSDVLVMFKAKAEMPHKYREEVKVLGVEAPLRMLEKLKELGKRELEGEQPAALEAPAIEAEYREVSVSRQEPTVETTPRVEGRGAQA